MEPTRETIESREEIHQLLQITKENNDILHGMRRRERIGNIFKILYFGFIVASFYGAYVFAQPYIEQIKNGLDTAQNAQNTISGSISNLGIHPDQISQIKEVLSKLNESKKN